MHHPNLMTNVNSDLNSYIPKEKYEKIKRTHKNHEKINELQAVNE